MRIQRAIMRKKLLTSIALGVPVLPRDKREYWVIWIAVFVFSIR